MTRVLIASEAETVRRGLEAVVTSTLSLEIVGSVADLSELGASVLEAAPDVVLVAPDPGLDEFLQMAASAIGGDGPAQPPFIVLTSDPVPAFMGVPVQAGIHALLPVHARAEEILGAIAAVASGLLVFHPSMVRADHTPTAPRRGPVPRLTGRELQILTMMAEGLGNKEIAWQLQISEHTVKFHITSIFNKLDVSSRAEAVSLGFRFGLILV